MDSFNTAFTDLIKKLPVGNTQLMKYVTLLGNERSTYAKYMIEKYLGNRLQRTSNSAEQNHWSMLYSLTGGRCRYNEDVHTFVLDLFKRQSDLLGKLNSELANQHFGRLLERDTILKAQCFSQENIDKLIMPAWTKLNLPSFRRFYRQCELSREYVVTATNTNFEIQRLRTHAPPRSVSLVVGLNRCLCVERMAFEGMCCHEIAAYGKFEPTLFKEWHNLREAPESSKNIGNFKNDMGSFRIDGWETTDATEAHPISNIDMTTDSHEGYMAANVEDNDRYSGAQSEQGDISINIAANVEDNDRYSGAQSGQRDISINIAANVEDNDRYSGAQREQRDITFREFHELSREVATACSNQRSAVKYLCYSYLKEMKNILTEKNGVEHRLRDLTAKRDLSLVSTLQENVVHKQGDGRFKRLKKSTEIKVVAQRIAEKKRCKFCRSEEHTICRCPVKISHGKDLTFLETQDYVLARSPFRIKLENEVIISQLPAGTYYIRVEGVIHKRQLASHLTQPYFQWKDLGIQASALNDHGAVIEGHLYDGESIGDFLVRNSSRPIFLLEEANEGPGWSTR